MNDLKPFASLGPTLLARKGGARPAMRPQLGAMGAGLAQAAPQFSPEPGAEFHPDLNMDLEDLGWNDMGENDDEEQYEAEILPLTPAPANPQAETEARADDRAARHQLEAVAAQITSEVEPEVRQQQRKIANAVTREAAEERPARRRRRAVDQGRRAAFTLRLDARRHLKLRLASTIKDRSAQQLVTQALDKYLSEIPEIEALAAQVARD